MWTIASVILGRLIPKNVVIGFLVAANMAVTRRPFSKLQHQKGSRPPGDHPVHNLGIGRPAVVSARSWAGLWAVVRAEGVVLTHSLGDFSPLKFSSPKTRIINLWHGMPIKRISTADPDFHTRSYAKSNLKEMARFECMVATSDAMAALFSKTFGLPDERVHRTGQPRTDILMSPQHKHSSHVTRRHCPSTASRSCIARPGAMATRSNSSRSPIEIGLGLMRRSRPLGRFFLSVRILTTPVSSRHAMLASFRCKVISHQKSPTSSVISIA